MNWEAIGSIGESISALAVVITLFYLARQMRENSRATKFDSQLKIRSFIAEHQKLLTIPENARIWHQGLSDPDSLSNEDLTRFFSLMTLLINCVESIKNYELSTGIDSIFGAEADAVTRLSNTPGFSRWWLAYKDTYGIEFKKYVERHTNDA